ncbi:tryptophan 2,3-dioxygenase family protein [Microtetraspora malaysiensis]|uniref:tryptophan 2,3-dioxygenase family protein n=1 Tax=Microtetraspora malaysiensis TaxID=161358 RepID=UPI003D928A03
MAGYHEYLELDQLLSLQRPRTGNLATELPFIVVHQVSELWFKLIIEDLRGAMDALGADDAGAAVRRLSRVHEVERLLIDQLLLIDRLPPGGFGELRPALGTASAAESRQFAVIERLSRPPSGRTAPADHPAEDLWTALCLHAQRDGYEMPTEDTDKAAAQRARSLLDIYWQAGPLAAVCEALVDHDQAFCIWRQRHALAVARQIGNAPGTGGTTGLTYLEHRWTRRFYPDLWAIRADLQISG